MDGLRGFGALTVMLWHGYLLLLPVAPYIFHVLFHQTPLAVTITGTQAVAVFFVLSGFVLTRSIQSPKFSWKQYYPKRILRLYLPTFVSFIVAALLIMAVPRFFSKQWDESWLATSNYTSISWEEFFKNITLQTQILNNPTWSIVYEIAFSLTLPLWIWVAKRINFTSSIIIVIGIVIASGYGFSLGLQWLSWAPVFGVGVLAATHWDKIAQAYSKLNQTKYSSYINLVLIVVSFGLMALHVFLWNNSQFTYALSILGAILVFLATALIPALQKVFNHNIFQFLGKISFSLYLLHVPIIVTMVFILPQEYIVLAVGIGCVVSVLSAIVFNKYVDIPSQLFARKVSQQKLFTNKA